jgi:hypothetical protein
MHYHDATFRRRVSTNSRRDAPLEKWAFDLFDIGGNRVPLRAKTLSNDQPPQLDDRYITGWALIEKGRYDSTFP